ncbi:23S rRNA (guanosine2251-2'-O)-methyltransferase [Barrientosiimonas humi]|uniref:23S rRNA (Guanosine2251-2'-O)-methyltransferase n=2 Tax=Barrientosiimonas TaxID=1535207 RepID=A0A542XF03_9MICO|nr:MULTISPECIES: 23S rRNA (guanosine(2251)-2'-O)-methyltransferase RlmB [Barrientosiimonas]TQL34402.1 23S rRNA (guanosine2251-2'-O)-methyltransferase [Barrientosiimonas humi]BDZ59464.1 23S rRNA (guanosine(2251)-2'-O)-methyltransferase RlmB [Barrientosiimonas endolithica]CAG7574392.1 putative tRNA/rRNA methyltransferase [Barrientosiimonas humi]
MAGNSRRRGAVRKTGSKKGAVVGSGGQRRRGLEGKGPTPKAGDRPNHKAYKSARRAESTAEPRKAAPARESKRAGGKAASTEVIAGRNSVVEALRSSVPASALYVAGRIDSDDRVREALKTAADRAIPILEAQRTELDRLSDGAVHQGIALQVPPYEYAHPADLVDPEAPGTPLVVALDGITDPRNLGAIVRSVAAFGGHGVVVPERRSAGMTAGAWKTSAGAAARVPVAMATNLTRALQDFRKAGFFVLGLDMDGDVLLPEVALADQPLVIVVGSEGKGLSRLVAETCDQIVSVPMSSAIESLNAGVAASVTLYEIARQRGLAR